MQSYALFLTLACDSGHETQKMKQNYFLFTRFFAVILFTALVSTKVVAGWLIIEQQDDSVGNFGSQTVFIQGQLLRIENEKSVFIIDLEKEQITLIFPMQQLYWTGHPDSLRQAISDKLQQQIDILLAQMPAGMRSENDSSFSVQLARFRAGEFVIDSSIRFEVRPLPGVDSVLNYPTKMLEFYADSILLERIWTTQAVNPYAEIDRQKLARLTSLFNPPSRVSAHRSYEEYKNITTQQFVLKSMIPTPYGNSITEVVTLLNKEIPLSLFEPAEDYQPALLESILEITMGEDKREVDNPFKNSATKEPKSPVPVLPPRPE